MTESGAMGSPIHIDYCSASYNLKHNFENSLGMGMTADDIQKKREYYLEALKYADTPDKKLLVFYLIAESTFSNPQKLLGKTRDSKTLKLNCDSLYDQWEAHPLLLSNDVLIVENIANSLALSPGRRYCFSFAPMKLQDSDGAPIRALAWEINDK
jgi:kynurenine formamidase